LPLSQFLEDLADWSRTTTFYRSLARSCMVAVLEAMLKDDCIGAVLDLPPESPVCPERHCRKGDIDAKRARQIQEPYKGGIWLRYIVITPP
jgi:hypothetical protein